MKNNTINKFISAFMAFAMMLSLTMGNLSLVAFAEEGTGSNPEQQETVAEEQNSETTQEDDNTGAEESTPTPVPSFTINYAAANGGKVSVMQEIVSEGSPFAGSTAIANSGYEFTNWTCNGVVVSTSETYVPIKWENATYTANFNQSAPQINSNGSVYIANYNVVDFNGNPLSKVNPGDTVIVAVTVVDERIPDAAFGVPRNSATGRIHVTMTQGAFTLPSASNIDVKTRASVGGALCYTVAFRSVTYLGGTPDFSFAVSYTDGTATTDTNVPLPVPQQTLGLSITQAVDDIPAPNVILNSANYGNVVTAGSNFTLATSAVNTSSALELDNVSVKIELPQGLSMASGNSQVLIGHVGKGGSINHNFALTASGLSTETAVLPVELVYSFEAFVNGQRQTFTSTQQISVNVQQATRFDIQEVECQEEVYSGENGYITVTLANKGKSTVYNVQAEIISEDFTGAEVEFVGNIAPGSTSEIDFNFMCNNVGTGKGKILITFEDASGNVSSIEKDFSIEVVEMPVWDWKDEPTDVPPVIEEKKNYTPFIIGGVVLAGAAGLFVYNKKKKAKRAAELEDEDEDI